MRGRAVLAVWLFALPVAAAPVAPFDKSGIADWTKAPEPTAEPTYRPPVARRMVLKNGMALLVIENHKLPIVALTLLVPGAGAAADPAGKGGLASFTADLLDEGAGGLSAIAIAEESDRVGATITVGVDFDAAEVSAQILTRTLDPTLDLITKIVTQPAFDPRQADRVRGDLMTALDQLPDRPREVVENVLSAALYGVKSAYGHPVTGTREEAKDLTVSEALAFYKQHWNPAVMTLVVAGDVDATALEAKLEAGLGAWTQSGTHSPARPVVAAQAMSHRLLLVDRPGAEQSDVRIGIVGLPRTDKRYCAFEVLATTVGGGFTSRLVQRLREQLGITYGVTAGMEWRVQPGPFVIGTAIVTAETGHGLTEAFKILDDLAAHELSAPDLERSKQNLIRALPAMFDTRLATTEAFAELALYGLRDDWFARYADDIRKVTAKDVKAAASDVIPSGKLVISIVGDLAKLRGALDKLGLGEPEIYDPYGLPLAR